MACPGSIAAQEAVTTPDEGSKASREGTSAHGLLELCIVMGYDPQDFLGYTLQRGMPPIAQHMIDGVRHLLDWLEEYLDFWGANNVTVLAERRVLIGSMIGVPDEVCNGTSDLCIVHNDRSRLVVVDYKHGVKIVEATDNPQLMLYTAGNVREYGKFKEYVNVVAQPRAAKKRAVEEYTFKQGKLTTFLKEVGKAAVVALSPNAPRVAGDHCTFCKASNNCQTYRQRARQIAADEFGEIEDPDALPSERLEEILLEADILEGWIKTVRARALAEAQAGLQFEHYQVGWGTRKRLFQDPELVAEWCERKGLSVDEYMPRALVTPKALEAVLKNRRKFPRAKRGEARPDSPIAHLVGYTTPKPVLKARTAGTTAEEDFAEDE